MAPNPHETGLENQFKTMSFDWEQQARQARERIESLEAEVETLKYNVNQEKLITRHEELETMRLRKQDKNLVDRLQCLEAEHQRVLNDYQGCEEERQLLLSDYQRVEGNYSRVLNERHALTQQNQQLQYHLNMERDAVLALLKQKEHVLTQSQAGGAEPEQKMIED